MTNKIVIPFSFLPPPLLLRLSTLFMGVAENIAPFFPFLELNLMQAEIRITTREYLSRCLAATASFFIFFSLVAMLFMSKTGNIFLGPLVVLFISMFIFLQQIMYPRLIASRRIRGIEQNLLPALRTILIQVNSGVPLFDVLVSLSSEDYGDISVEFKKAVKQINTGTPEVIALEELATENPSLFFRRAIWQLVNGVKAGASIEAVIKEVIDSVAQEQIIQIENYGSQLNPMAMFYMLVAIIMPALGMTFLIVLSSFISLSDFATKLIFWGLYSFVLFFQVMFLGMIRTRRPNLLTT